MLSCTRAGWRLGDATGPGTSLHHAYLQASTTAWLGIVACQVGSAFAVRTDHASLRSVGVLSNRPLLAGIGVSLAFAALLIYVPFLQNAFGTTALSPAQLATVAPFPLLVWGVDELRRAYRRSGGHTAARGGSSRDLRPWMRGAGRPRIDTHRVHTGLLAANHTSPGDET